MINILELFKIAGKIELDGADKANRDLDKLDGKGKGLGSKLGGFAKNVGKAGLLIGGAAVAAGTAAFAMTKKVTDGFDHIAKTSTKLGVSTDAYQEMDYWASQNGISSQSMERAIGRLNQRIGLAADGNEKYSTALEALGVDMSKVKDGTMTTEDVMAQSIKTLSEMESETEKSAMASELFGTKMARDLMPALQDGSLSLEDAAKKAKELGIVIDEDTLRAAEEFNDTWDDLTRSAKAGGQKLLAGLMPAFQTMMDWVIAHMPKMQSIFGKVFGVIGTILSKVRGYIKDAIDWFVKMRDGAIDSVGGMGTIFENFKPFIDRFKQSFEMLVQSLGPIWESLKQLFQSLTPILELVGAVIVVMYGIWMSVFSGIIAAIGPVINAVINLVDFVVNMVNVVVALLTGDFAGAWEFLKDAGQSAIDFFMNLMNGVIDLLATFIDTIIDYFYGLYMTLVGNSIIPDMVEAIIEWFQNMFQWLIDIVMNIVDGIVEAFTAIYETITSYFEMVWEVIQSVWDYIKETFSNALDFILALVTGDFEGMKNAIQSQMENAQNLLENIWNAIDSFLSNTLGGIWDTIKSVFSSIFKTIGSILKNTSNTVSSIWNTIKNVVSNAVNNVRNVVTTVFNAVRSVISNVMNSVRSTISSIWNGIRSTISSVVNGIRSTISSVFNAIRSVISSVMSSVRSTISSVWNGIRSTISSVVNGIRSTISSIFNSLRGIVTGAMNGVRSAVSNGITGALNVITNMGSSFKNAGSKIVTMIADGIKGAASKVTGAAKDLMGKVRDYLPFSPAKVGPLTDIHKLNFDGPIGDSIENAIPDVQAKMNAMLQVPAVKASNQSAIGDVSPVISSAKTRNANGNYVTENNGINRLLEATLEQSQILMQLLNKNQDLYMEERVVGSILSPIIDENLERERRIRERFRG